MYEIYITMISWRKSVWFDLIIPLTISYQDKIASLNLIIALQCLFPMCYHSIVVLDIGHLSGKFMDFLTEHAFEGMNSYIVYPFHFSSRSSGLLNQ